MARVGPGLRNFLSAPGGLFVVMRHQLALYHGEAGINRARKPAHMTKI
jgi:hypothetical protein